MNIFRWDLKLEVGFEKIDAQHKGLVAIINSLHELYTEGGDPDRLSELLNRLGQYSKSHFDMEEKYMDRLGDKYPDAVSHKKAHVLYFNKIWQFAKVYKKENQSSIILDIIKFLMDWWVNHITHVDKKFSQILIDNGYV